MLVVGGAAVAACAKLGGLDDLERVACYGDGPCDAGVDARIDSAPSRDASDADDRGDGDAAPRGGFVCGDRACVEGAESCCGRRDGGGTSCSLDSCRDDLLVLCVNDEACVAGRTCCAEAVGGSSVPNIITCDKSCEWPICTPDGGCPGDAGLTCHPTVPGAPSICQRP